MHESPDLLGHLLSVGLPVKDELWNELWKSSCRSLADAFTFGYPCACKGRKLLLIFHPDFNYVLFNLQLGFFSCLFYAIKFSLNLIFSPLRHTISPRRQVSASFWRHSVTSFVFYCSSCFAV